MKRISLPLFFSLLSFQADGQSAEPIKVHVNGVDLYYIEQGRGEPLILLHGGQGDYRSWGPQMEALSSRYRVISYSRRYNFPSNNPLTPDYRSGKTDARDLAALIRQLGLGRVHLVGTSAGALAALTAAVDRPQLVRSLVLAEPPILRWAKDDPRGNALYEEFIANMWKAAGAAFKSGDDLGAMKILVDGFAGPGAFDKLPAASRAAAMQNSRFFKVSTGSSDPFPELSKEKVRRLGMPVLIITGADTIKIHKFVDDELARLLPKAQRATIPNAGHGSSRENPQAFNGAVIDFLGNL